MKKTLLSAAVFWSLCSMAGAQTVTPSPTPSQKFRVFRNTTAQALSTSAAITIQFNAKDFDASNICDVSTTFVCTPTIAGTYYFICQVDSLSTTGPILGNTAIADAQLSINGATVSQSYVTPQVTALTSPRAFASASSIVAMNGTTDTVGCKSSNDSTGPTALNGQAVTFMYGYRTGP